MFKDTSGDDRASASTIGIILLVAITVILGATIAGYMLDLRSSVESGGPDASFQYQYNSISGDLKITHESGEPVNGSQIRFAGAANEYTTFNSIQGWKGQQVESGDTVTVDVDQGETFEIIWRSLEGDKTEVLSTYEVSSVGPAAEGSISVDADIASNEADVTVSGSDIDEAPDGQAYLKVEGPNGTASQQISSTQTITFTESDIGVFNSGETITATLYESSSESNKIAEGSDTTPSATVTNVDATGTSSGGDGNVTVTFTAQNADRVTVYLDDNPADNGGGNQEIDEQTSVDVAGGSQTVTFELTTDAAADDEDLYVSITEEGESYELTNVTVPAGRDTSP